MAPSSFVFQPRGRDRRGAEGSGEVRSPAGPSGYGLFFFGQLPSAQPLLRPVLLPGESLPIAAGGQLPAVTDEYFWPSIDDSGRIAFLAQLAGSAGRSAYVWEYGGTDPVLISSGTLPSGARIIDGSGVWLNDQDRRVLLSASTNRMSGNQ